VFVIHASGLLWASARMDDVRAFQRMRQERNVPAGIDPMLPEGRPVHL
jgi:hypothetical protein